MFVFFFVFVIGITAGFVDSTVGSGGLISIPLLIFLGLPPQVAIATDRLGTVGQGLGAFFTFWKAKKIQWSYIIPFSLLAFLGAFLGARLLLQINPFFLKKIIAGVLLFVVPLLYFQKNAGIHTSITSPLKKTVGFSVYFFIMIYNGFLGTGAGPLSLYNQITFFGFTIIEANATSIIPWFLLALSSLAVFMLHNIVNFQNGIWLLLGMLLGGYLGAKSALYIGNKWIKRLFLVFVVISGIKLLFF